MEVWLVVVAVSVVIIGASAVFIVVSLVVVAVPEVIIGASMVVTGYYKLLDPVTVGTKHFYIFVEIKASHRDHFSPWLKCIYPDNRNYDEWDMIIEARLDVIVKITFIVMETSLTVKEEVLFVVGGTLNRWELRYVLILAAEGKISVSYDALVQVDEVVFIGRRDQNSISCSSMW